MLLQPEVVPMTADQREAVLADGHKSLAILSADLGFADQSHLSRVVRANTGERLSALRHGLGRWS
jgi:AraC-like DNA-binding protein